MLGAQVLPEDIEAEIIAQITPDGMDMVPIVLGVVVFEQEGRALDPVIMFLALFQTPGPGEADARDAGFLDLGEIGIRHLRAQPPDEFPHQSQSQFPLRRRQIPERHPFRRPGFGLLLVEGQDVGRGGLVDERGLALRFRQGMDQFPGEILLGAQHPETGPPADPDLGRIGAHERRRAGGDLAVDQGEIDRKMVPLDPPTPGALGCRGPENADMVEQGIAGETATRSFHVLKDLLQAHDRGGLEETAVTQPGGEQPDCQVLLCRTQFLQGDPLALHRHEMPVQPLLRRPLETGLGPLVIAQGSQEMLRGLGHFGGDIRGRETCGQQEAEEQGQGFHKGECPDPARICQSQIPARHEVRPCAGRHRNTPWAMGWFHVAAVLAVVIPLSAAVPVAAPVAEVRVPGPAGDRIYDVAPGEWHVRDGRRETFVTAPLRSAVPQGFGPDAVFEAVVYPRGQAHTPAHRHVWTARVAARLVGPLTPEAVGTAVGAIRVRPLAALPGTFVFEAGSATPEAASALRTALEHEPGVRAVVPILAAPRAARWLPRDPLLARQWHLRNTGQTGGTTGADANVAPAWGAGFTGRGVNVAVVDDGVESTHPDLAAHAHPEWGHDYRDGDDDPSPEGEAGFDPFGEPLADSHGTSVAGIAAAVGDNSIGGTGAAYEAGIVPVRLIGGNAAADDQEAGALGHRTDVVDVSNNSWGPNDDGQTIESPGPLTEAAMEAAARDGRGGRGVIYVWAGGNGGESDDNVNNDGYANSIHTIAVGALTDKGTRTTYSEPGACLIVSAAGGGDIVRPAGILTTDLVGDRGYNDGAQPDELSDANHTKLFNGTSASAPVVAGVVALVLQANPALGARDVQEILLRSAALTDPNNKGWSTNAAGFRFNPGYGAGRVDAAAAVKWAAPWTNLGLASVLMVDLLPKPAARIPDGPTAGWTHDFKFTSPLRVEHVRLTVGIRHPSRGELGIQITSPSGTVSPLFLTHDDPNPDINHRFVSVQTWGEPAQGTWRVRINDVLPGNIGFIDQVRLEVIGTTPAAPVPAVLQVVGPGPAGFELTLSGNPGERWRVERSADLLVWQPVEEVELGTTASPVTDAPATDDAANYRALRLFP